MARMNGFAEEIPDRPVSLPVLNLPPLDDDAETKETAARFFQHRTIRLAADAWQSASADKAARSKPIKLSVPRS